MSMVKLIVRHREKCSVHSARQDRHGWPFRAIELGNSDGPKPYQAHHLANATVSAATARSPARLLAP